MAIFRKLAKFILVIIFRIFPKNVNLGLKIKILKFLGIQPNYKKKFRKKGWEEKESSRKF